MKPPQPSFKPRILVAPLDWGLGHASRCVPIIHCLLTNGAEVLLAGDGKVEALLKTEFPELFFVKLPGYHIAYGHTKWGTFTKLIRQLPKLLRSIRQENAWLQKAMETYKIDAVISDNRYGLQHATVFSVFVTHQLLVKTPAGSTDALLQRFIYPYINRFHACWVPDLEKGPGFAGTLSHPKLKPKIPVTYIGLLSRFNFTEPALPYYVLILLSGPEPQRTILEKKLLQQSQLFQKPILVVRGLPGSTGLPAVPYHVTIVNHLPAATLQKAIESAAFVVGRCGYSTVMDAMILQKKCIFIPTPMQTEQQYLARHMMKHHFALCLPQDKFNLERAVALAASFPYRLPVIEKDTALQNAVKNLLQQVKRS